MKKNNNQGFMLIETLICATFIVTILVALYVQFRNINQSYEDSFKYNTVNNLYLTNQARLYIRDNGFGNLQTALENQNYVDITSCPSEYLTEVNYCTKLFDSLKIKQIIVTTYDISAKISDTDNFSPDFADFIGNFKLIKDGYTVYIEFTDETFAFLKV